MDTLLAKLTLLIDISNEKKTVLEQILNICENQQYAYQQPYTETRTEMIRGIGHEKQKLVDQVIACDDAFQATFGGCQDELAQSSQHYRPRILELQGLIKDILDMDIKIRHMENVNKQFYHREKPQAKEPDQAAKIRILEQYKANNRKK